MTSGTAAREAGLDRVLTLPGARAAEAVERPEHLQTESNEAARPPRTNQFTLTLKEQRRDPGS